MSDILSDAEVNRVDDYYLKGKHLYDWVNMHVSLLLRLVESHRAQAEQIRELDSVLLAWRRNLRSDRIKPTDKCGFCGLRPGPDCCEER